MLVEIISIEGRLLRKKKKEFYFSVSSLRLREVLSKLARFFSDNGRIGKQRAQEHSSQAYVSINNTVWCSL